MSFFDNATRLAARGFYVFPLVPGTKTPAVQEFKHVSTRDTEKIRNWAYCPLMGWEQPFDVGIAGSKFGSHEWHLLIVDVDDKDGKKGSDEIFNLEMEGKEFPPTYTQKTPSGGSHLVYRTKIRFRNSASRIAPGIDVRGFGGLIVGSGSEIDGKAYTDNGQDVETAPLWLEEACVSAPGEDTGSEPAVLVVDQYAATKRAVDYLLRAKPSVEGSGGNHNAFAVAAQLRDFGIDSSYRACELLFSSGWNDRCQPPWDQDELLGIVEHAYQYAHDKVGSHAPEAVFSPVVEAGEEGKSRGDQSESGGEESAVQSGDDAGARDIGSPIEEINKNHAFVIESGGHHVLWETTDAYGRFQIKRLPEVSFHRYHASKFISKGDGETELVTKAWMKSRTRRTYRGYCFRPGLEPLEGYYNLFRGWAVTPLAPTEPPSPAAKKSVDDFLEHTLQNVCDNNQEHFKWLIGFFAHMFQKPWEKPLVALVLKGKKGVGKSAILERVGYLLGSHNLTASNRRYLTSNFNGHLENLLFFTLNEAFWSGDKQAEGVLKDLVTGGKHVIERKGSETYEVENRTRIAVVGNEDWLVPASEDERRYAVFNVGDGRKQHGSFFQTMREEMERGGYRWLLRYLLDYDLTGINVNVAPITQGLLDQKMSSNNLVHKWWVECLTDGYVIGNDLGDERWPEVMPKESMKTAISRYYRESSGKAWKPDSRTVFKMLKECLPTISNKIKITRADGERVNGYDIPPLEEARKQWEKYIGHEVQW